MILVSGVSLGVKEPQEKALAKAVKMLRIKESQVVSHHITKVSIDARKRSNIRLVYTLGVTLTNRELEQQLSCANSFVKQKQPLSLQFQKGTEKLTHRPVVVGFGPAGMFAALLLAQQGYRPNVFERGYSVEEREQAVDTFWKTGKLNVKSNVQFGEGGAGTFSDGKLTTRINDPLCQYVLEQFVAFGAPEEIRTKAKPHIGTDYLKRIVKHIRQEIIRLGGEVHFESQVEDFLCENNRLKALVVNGEKVEAQTVILAVGHSARDTFGKIIKRDFSVETKPFSVGLRVEHLQSDIDKGLFGEYAGIPQLGKGEYRLSYRNKDRGVYTFCMCPGGTVVPSASGEGTVVVNGMSEFSRDKQNANSAIVVSVGQQDFGSNPKEAIAFQEQLEQKAFLMGGSNYKAPVQDIGSFLKGKAGYKEGRVSPSYAIGTTPADFTALFPRAITGMLQEGLTRFGRKLKGFDAPDGVLTGVETRTSSPIRILRDNNLQSPTVQGLYPTGEGAGYAGGIMSAAVDGLKVAKTIIETYKSK